MQRTPSGRGPPTPGTNDQFKEMDARIAELQRLREEMAEASATQGQRPDAAPAAAADPSAGAQQSAMEAEAVEASEAPKEDGRVEMGVVHLAYDAQLPYDKRERVADEHILGAYYGMACGLDDVSPFPTDGFNRVGGKGPWKIVIPFAQAERFAEKKRSSSSPQRLRRLGRRGRPRVQRLGPQDCAEELAHGHGWHVRPSAQRVSSLARETT